MVQHRVNPLAQPGQSFFWGATPSKYGLKRLACLASTVVFLVLLIVIPTYADDNNIYVVRPGDTLVYIAAEHNLTATQLGTANGLRWSAGVYVGQRLRIPDPSSTPSASTTASTGGTYIVRRGDTLTGIAARYGVTVTQLAQANGLRWNAWVYIGQRLKIPGQNTPPVPPPTSSPGGTYIVRRGDTLIGIAARHNITVAQLAQANGLFTNSWVYTGQRLKIPGQNTPPKPPVTPPPSTGTTYVVRPGDTLSGIAVRHGVSISRLAAANGLRVNSWVYTGQRLKIPGSGSPPPSSPPPQNNSGKWIDINLSRQRVTAYSGQTALRSFVVSTGTWRTPTVVGTFRIYVKYVSTRMAGPGYNLPNVPYTMYFYGGYGLHGTYWHNNFGTPMSHGCVNLRTPDAQWLYNWAPVGTKVVSHY